MLFATIGQGAIFLWMTAAGAVIGAVTLAFDALRCILQAGKILSAALDFAAGAVASAVLIAALIIGNYGRVRFYELFAAALGLRCSIYVSNTAFAAASPAHAAMKKLAALLKAAGKRLNSYKVIKYLLK